MELWLAAYLVMALALLALVIVALRRPGDRAWLRRSGWVFVLAMTVSIAFGVLARLV